MGATHLHAAPWHHLMRLMRFVSNYNAEKLYLIIGRYYAMDRDKRWERIQKAYDLLVQGKADLSCN